MVMESSLQPGERACTSFAGTREAFYEGGQNVGLERLREKAVS